MFEVTIYGKNTTEGAKRDRKLAGRFTVKSETALDALSEVQKMLNKLPKDKSANVVSVSVEIKTENASEPTINL